MDITIAAGSFQQEVWGNQFFPDDLPENWRFDYYANEFDAVLLSEAEQQAMGDEMLLEIMREADAEFVFVLEASSDRKVDIDTESVVIQVEFSSVGALVEPSVEIVEVAGISIELAEVVSQQNMTESACVLRVSSIRSVTNEEIKQLLESISGQYAQCDHVFLFFCEDLQDTKVLGTAQIINDLCI